MHKVTIVGLILILGIGGFFALNSFIYNEKQGDGGEEPVPAEGIAEYDTYTDTKAGLMFEYKTEPDGYVVDDLSGFIGEEDTEVVTVLRVMNEREKIELETSEGGREGPPTINLMVHENPNRRTVSQWVDATPRFSSIEMALGEIDRDAVVGGANAVRYQSDGLYVSENVVVAHGAYIYHFTGSFHEPDSTIHQDFKALIDSVTFIPTDTAPISGSPAKIDPQVACESALSYMLFRTSEDADAFVAECVAGEHPDVIERYIESLGVDGAAV